MSQTQKLMMVALAILPVLLFGVFVWPTPYEYIPAFIESIPPGEDRSGTVGGTVIYRVNRFTGTTKVINATYFILIKPEQSPKDETSL